MAKILITGGTGLIGKAICDILIKKNHTPVLLSRETGEWRGIKKYGWDVEKGIIDGNAFNDVEHLIHLAGAGIADKRWTKKYKKKIIDSRIKSSALLLAYMKSYAIRLKSFVGGSAIGYYGAKQSPSVFTEDDLPGNDFIGQTVRLWEQSYNPFIDTGIRTAVIRTGIVLSRDSGAYKTLASPFRLGLGAAADSGKQYMSWIHIRDIAEVFVYALFNEHMAGVYNAVASEPVTNQEFSKKISLSLHKPFFLPNVPGSVLKALRGESAVLITEGVKINNAKLKAAGFKFEFESLDAALVDLAGK